MVGVKNKQKNVFMRGIGQMGNIMDMGGFTTSVPDGIKGNLTREKLLDMGLLFVRMAGMKAIK